MESKKDHLHEKKPAENEETYLTIANSRLERLNKVQQISNDILNSKDPKIQKLRIELKKQAGASNQISATPSSVKRVTHKLCTLLQVHILILSDFGG